MNAVPKQSMTATPAGRSLSGAVRTMTLGLLLGGAALLQSPQVLAQPALEKLKFSLDWRFEGQTSYMWLGLARKYFAEEGIDLQVDAGTGSASAIQRIHTGAYDAGMGDMSSLIEYVGNNPGQYRVQMVYQLYDEAPLAYYVLKKNGARGFADLAGKTITGAPYEVTRKMFPMIARAAKIDPGSVKFMTVDPALRSNAVIKGDAYAAGGFMNVPMEFETRGIKREELTELRVSDLGVRIYGNGVMVSSRLISEKPKLVAALVRAINRSFREGLADPVASVRALRQREPLAIEAVELQRFTMLIPAMVNDRTRSSGLGAINKLVLENQADEVAVAFAVKNKPNVDVIFNSSFLPSRGERLPLPTR
jgi:ABC-type nitrate/sulfonate/bicarbonate transport system substrate-binding protein